MRVLHALDNSNRGGIQELVFRLFKNSKHQIEFWAADGSASEEMRAAGMILWNSEPPNDIHYDVYVGHGVGGWSYNNSFDWAHSRGMKTVEVMHSNATSQTSPEKCDGFVGLSNIARGLNAHMPSAITIYGVVEAPGEISAPGDRIGRLSRLVQEKRPQDLLEIAKYFPGETFLLAGAGNMEEQLKAQGVFNVEFEPWVRDYQAFFSKLKLFVFPTQDECCCISVAQAQAAGVPVICQDIPALRETTGGAALFASSISDFVERIGEYLRYPGVYKEMGNLGRHWAMKKFSVPITVGAWDNYLEGLAGA